MKTSANMRERGVALITMLLVFAMVTAVTGGMVFKNRLDIKRMQTMTRSAQAYEYAKAGVTAAKLHIQSAPLNENPISLTLAPSQEVVSITLTDEMGKFNINNLRDQTGQTDPIQVAIFKRLLTALELDPSLANAIADWVDSDMISSSHTSQNTEDLGYSNLYLAHQRAYRAANRPIADISELRFIAGVTAMTYDRLMPYITALPETTAVNINSASAPVLAALIPGIDRNEISSLRRDKPLGFRQINDFLQHRVTAGIDIQPALITTESNYYSVISSVSFDNQSSIVQGLIYRQRTQEAAVEGTEPTWNAKVISLQKKPFWMAQIGSSNEQ